MTRMKRAVAMLCFAFICFLAVACGGPQVVEPPTYSQAQLEQLDIYRQKIEQVRNRLTELPDLVAKESWTNVENLLHGPLGSLRQEMALVARNLLPDEQPAARQEAKELFRHLELIDLATDGRNAKQALNEYQSSLDGFDAYLGLIPPLEAASDTTAEAR